MVVVVMTTSCGVVNVSYSWYMALLEDVGKEKETYLGLRLDFLLGLEAHGRGSSSGSVDFGVGRR